MKEDLKTYLPQKTGSKVCTRCKMTSGICDFYACKRSKDGRDSACKKCIQKYKMERLNTVPEIRIVENLRRRTRAVLQGINKSDSTLKLIGCTPKELKSHIQSLFQDGMSWDNYGLWHIDHIMPCASFDLVKEEQQRKCFHHSNLQPLWAEDNLSKGDRYVNSTNP